MPDYGPSMNWDEVTNEQAAELSRLIVNRRRLEDMVVSRSVPPGGLKDWACKYLDAMLDMEHHEAAVCRAIFMQPWTVHIAGAPGHDQEYECGDEDCENPYCGKVQKCSRCHDVLVLGFSAAAQMGEMINTMMTGRGVQEVMHLEFGDNPVDEDGPTWFPIGTEVGKRPRGPQNEEIRPVSTMKNIDPRRLIHCVAPELPKIDADQVLKEIQG